MSKRAFTMKVHVGPVTREQCLAILELFAKCSAAVTETMGVDTTGEVTIADDAPESAPASGRADTERAPSSVLRGMN